MLVNLYLDPYIEFVFSAFFLPYLKIFYVFQDVSYVGPVVRVPRALIF
jgi:hypothetical protein